MRKFYLFLFAFSAGLYFSQTNLREHVSGFNMMSFTYKHDKKWSLYVEIQGRQIEDYSKIDYYETKGGIGYNLNKNNQAFVGIGKYGTYKNAMINQEEFRVWLQYVFSQNLHRLKVDHRVRAEKRFFNFPQLGTSSNDERLRYRILFTLPLNSDKVEPKTFYANAYEEIFFAPKDPNFKRNRIYGGFGYQFNDYLNANLGYLFQREFSTTINRNLHYIYFGVNFTFDRLKHHESSHIQIAN